MTSKNPKNSPLKIWDIEKYTPNKYWKGFAMGFMIGVILTTLLIIKLVNIC